MVSKYAGIVQSNTHLLKQQIFTKDDITLQHSDIMAMLLQSNITFCDICCVRSASLLLLSLKGVVNC